MVGLINHAGGEVLKGGKKGGGERGRLVFALCYFKTHIGVAVQNYTFNSSVLRGAPGRGGKEEREGKRRGDRDFLSCDFRHIRRGGALISAARAIHCTTGSGAVAWRYARARAPWSK